MLPGQRAAGAAWVQRLAEVLAELHFDRCPIQPQLFVRRGGASGHGAVGETHMDDIHFCGAPSELNG